MRSDPVCDEGLRVICEAEVKISRDPEFFDHFDILENFLVLVLDFALVRRVEQKFVLQRF